jgi:hypothetical protein
MFLWLTTNGRNKANNRERRRRVKWLITAQTSFLLLSFSQRLLNFLRQSASRQLPMKTASISAPIRRTARFAFVWHQTTTATARCCEDRSLAEQINSFCMTAIHHHDAHAGDAMRWRCVRDGERNAIRAIRDFVISCD